MNKETDRQTARQTGRQTDVDVQRQTIDTHLGQRGTNKDKEAEEGQVETVTEADTDAGIDGAEGRDKDAHSHKFPELLKLK